MAKTSDKKATPEDIEALKNLYSTTNLTYQEIGDKLGFSKAWASETCIRLIKKGELQKVPFRKQGKKARIEDIQRVPFDNDVDTGKLFALWRAGWSIEAIADDMWLNPKQVAEIVERGEQ